MIRKAAPDDFESILNLSEHFWQHTIFDEPFIREDCMFYVNMAFDCDLLVVAEAEEKIIGFCAAIKAPLMCNSSAMVATEVGWWVEPEYRGVGMKLKSFIENAAKDQGVKYMGMISMKSATPEIAEKIYLRTGYTEAETTFIKVL